MEKSTIEQLRELVNVQGKSGNWNYDPYMHGMYNGMELALATLENREPTYKEAPKMWICDYPLGKLCGEVEETSVN